MKTKRALITQMLEALEYAAERVFCEGNDDPIAKASEAAREYLAAPEQSEPVAWMCSNNELMYKGYQRFAATTGGDWNIPVYTHPAPKAEPLTDEQISLMAHNIDEGDWNSLHYKECWHKGFMEGARAVLAAQGVKK